MFPNNSKTVHISMTVTTFAYTQHTVEKRKKNIVYLNTANVKILVLSIQPSRGSLPQKKQQSAPPNVSKALF